ncbi:pyridoxine 5'-phosphate synthase [Methyloligella sp. 2.7D]|uniref:pyridoxine 5'-phosphate synthase n=1 Tax=unclassified Methyloligella TaxID=2625955 RepID=UPI00157C4201|nr:pyridoxine 5'-phosphate synthase [Methyloligella sp. GL2]QKP77614.1 pyridoxine 5'-phosphate synthase [Methyloligella sp. GL2]
MPEFPPIRLGVNIDHVATLRNARGAPYPDLKRAAQVAIDAGADNITAHLREDRRHIRDADIAMLAEMPIPLNMEMAVTPEMQAIALQHRPHACCLVPERREELTTEGGLDAAAQGEGLSRFIRALRAAGIRVSLFLDPDLEQIAVAADVGADAVELHTGTYCNAEIDGRADDFARELARIETAAAFAAEKGLEVHAGHGFTYTNVKPVAAIPQVVELNIGHFLISEGIFVGLRESIRHMHDIMRRTRKQAAAQAEEGAL